MSLLNQRIVGMGLTGALLVAATMVASFEGEHQATYLDPPGIQTICFGHTSKVTKGQTATDEDCIRFLKEDLLHANSILDRQVTVPLSDKQRAALLSFVFNIGEGNFRKSTLRSKLNKGNYEGACNELSKWVYSKGKKLTGLVRRREAEKVLCLSGTKMTPVSKSINERNK